MAEYKVINTTQLDSDLASVADAIRTKGGTTENLEFPNGFVNAVNAIETREQYQVYEVKFDFETGYIGASTLNNNILVVEVANQVEKEDGSVETLPENAVIKKVEFFFNGEMHSLEDAQKLDNRDVWVCYHTVHEFINSEFLGGRAIASLNYFNINDPSPDSLLYCLLGSCLEYDSPIRVYYTTE